MLSISPDTLTERENYKFLTGSIIPRPVAFVTTVTDEGILNGAPFSFFNIVSSNPPMISLSIQRSDGKQKDTARNLLKQKEFVVHIVDEHNVEMINKTAASLPPDESEVELAGLSSVPSTKISVPGIQEAKVRGMYLGAFLGVRRDRCRPWLRFDYWKGCAISYRGPSL